MISPKAVEISAVEASGQIRQALQRAKLALDADDHETALDSLVSALGLALQLGPAATEQVLTETVTAARQMARQRDADALSALGPALVGLANQVRDTDTLPKTAVMEAWAGVASGLGMLFGQLGLALTIVPEHRSGMMTNASTRASLWDNATGNLFELASWLDEMRGDLQEEEPAGWRPP